MTRMEEEEEEGVRGRSREEGEEEVSSQRRFKLRVCSHVLGTRIKVLLEARQDGVPSRSTKISMWTTGRYLSLSAVGGLSAFFDRRRVSEAYSY